MTTLLVYLVFAAIIGGVVFVAAVFVFGRGERMAPLPPRTSPAQLPSSDITGEDVRRVRFAVAARGYRMSDVDWTLDRLSSQLDELRAENARLRGHPVESDTDAENPATGPLAVDAHEQAAWADACESEPAGEGGDGFASEPSAAGSTADTEPVAVVGTPAPPSGPTSPVPDLRKVPPRTEEHP